MVDGKTPLESAIKLKRTECISILREFGASDDSKDGLMVNNPLQLVMVRTGMCG